MTEPDPHTIADHEGILAIHPVPGRHSVEIEFDPARLDDEQIRRIASEHFAPKVTFLRRCALRLDGQACEAAAAKLEHRIEKVSGVRRATATYIGRILCLTFDSQVASEDQVLADVRKAGARVRPLEIVPNGRADLWKRIRSGELNEDLSCVIGFLSLSAALVAAQLHASAAVVGILYGGAYLFCGQYGVRSALASLRERTLDVDVLMVLAALGAALVGAPFEGALLLFLFSFSNVLQRHAMERTQKAIESLLTLRPDRALVKRGSVTELVPVEQLVVGDIVVVRPGEHIPIDGIVCEGSSSVDESTLTGESMPVSKTVGSSLFAGTLNQNGGIELTVSKLVEDSTLARMVSLVAQAQAEKSRTQRFLERAEQYYATGVICFTVLVLLVPWLLWGESFYVAFYRAMTIMVVASPCALVISTPATVLSAIGGAARRGILIKGGSHLELAAQIDIVALDKTGTLTVGKPTVTEIVTADGMHLVSDGLPTKVKDCLSVCAALEARSEHPLAAAIVGAAARLGLPLPPAREFQATPGKGAEATIEGVRVVIGSERLFRELAAGGMEYFTAAVAPLSAMGKTCVWMGVRERGQLTTRAVLALADPLRPGARQIITELRRLGVKRIVMLTGDQSAVAQAIAGEAGVDEIQAELLPEAKMQVIRELRRKGRVMMVGDGVNDAPALAAADLGVAMGAVGTDIAMETADIVLMGDRLESIPLLLGLARHARRVLRQNLTFATVVIVVLIATTLGLALPLPLGVIGHEGSTVIVCLSGLRLLVYSSVKPT